MAACVTPPDTTLWEPVLDCNRALSTFPDTLDPVAVWHIADEYSPALALRDDPNHTHEVHEPRHIHTTARLP